VLLESLALLNTWVLASSKRRIQARYENVVKVKFIRKGISYNRIKVGGNEKRRNISCFLCRKWE
jgi:hypothetical protein